MGLSGLALALVVAAGPPAHVVLKSVRASERTAAVTREVRTHLEPLEGCYDLASQSPPAPAGTLVLTFRVEPGQGVTDISASPDSLQHQVLVPCVMARLRAGSWPVRKSPLTVTVTLTFRSS